MSAHSTAPGALGTLERFIVVCALTFRPVCDRPCAFSTRANSVIRPQTSPKRSHCSPRLELRGFQMSWGLCHTILMSSDSISECGMRFRDVLSRCMFLTWSPRAGVRFRLMATRFSSLSPTSAAIYYLLLDYCEHRGKRSNTAAFALAVHQLKRVFTFMTLIGHL